MSFLLPLILLIFLGAFFVICKLLSLKHPNGKSSTIWYETANEKHEGLSFQSTLIEDSRRKAKELLDRSGSRNIFELKDGGFLNAQTISRTRIVDTFPKTKSKNVTSDK